MDDVIRQACELAIPFSSDLPLAQRLNERPVVSDIIQLSAINRLVLKSNRAIT